MIAIVLGILWIGVGLANIHAGRLMATTVDLGAIDLGVGGVAILLGLYALEARGGRGW